MVKWFPYECSFLSKPLPTNSDHCDTQETVSRFHNSSYNGKFIHISKRHNTMFQLLKDGIIAIDYMKSRENIAHLLIKRLARGLVQKNEGNMVKPIRN